MDVASGSQGVAAGGDRVAVEVVKTSNGINQYVLSNSQGASARVSSLGGQVLSWKTHRGEELLFTSRKASINSSVAVRGGIPICFPEFETIGKIERHGYTRNRIWTIDDNPPPLPPNDSNGKAYVDLLFKPSKDELKFWPHSFEFRLRVSLNADGHLTLISRIRNIDRKPFSFFIVFHTYFSISDISEVRIEELETLHYFDNLREKECFTAPCDALTFESEVDRVYVETPDTVAVFDHGIKRTFVIRKQGLPDVVVWNPWDKKAKSLKEFGKDDYKKMVCVDGAAIKKPIKLKPGEEWTGRLELSMKRSS